MVPRIKWRSQFRKGTGRPVLSRRYELSPRPHIGDSPPSADREKLTAPARSAIVHGRATRPCIKPTPLPTMGSRSDEPHPTMAFRAKRRRSDAR